MKINSLYISAFGGIKNLKLDFANGFNIIYGDNEQGKTTIMSFIKMIFYGSERASAQISKNIRKKYTPWDGSAMAGSIDFEHNGKKYRLEKEFRSSNSTDKATLCDLDFGTRQAVSSDIGTKFFGLSSAAFERSVFIGQFGYPESDLTAEGEINSKLSNLASTGEESVSFDMVAKRLEKAKLALMSKSGRAGEYDKNIKLCASLQERIEKANSDAAQYKGKKAQITAAEQEITQMLKTAQELKAQIDAEQDIRNAEKLREYLKLKADLDALNQTLKLSDGSFIDEIYLSKLKFCISKAETAKQKTDAKLSETETLKKSIEAGLNPPEDANPETAKLLEKDISLLKAKTENNLDSISELKTRLSDCENHSKSNKKGPKIIIFIAGLLCLAAAIGLFIAKLYIPFGIAGIISAVLIAVYNVLSALNKKSALKLCETIDLIKSQIEGLETENRRIDDEIFSKKVKLEAISAALSSSAAVIENQQKMLNEANSQLEELKAAEKAEEKALLELFSRYRPAADTEEITSCIDKLTEKTSKQKELKQQLNFISKDIGGISYEDARRKLDEIGDTSENTTINFAEIKAQYEQLISKASEKKSLIAALTAEIKALLSHTENPEELKKQLKDVAEKAMAQKEFCDASDIALAVLTESFAEVRRSYGSVLEKTAGEIFKELTNEKYADMSISKSFDINVSEKDVFGSREVDYLSSGTADQAYLALRLAISKLICKENEALPLFLDDALTQYDDTRMTAALEFLNAYSDQTQIIMFTCHNAINTAAKNSGAQCISIKK